MQIGLTVTLSDSGMPMGVIARAAEERGFESLWVGEHTHIPVGFRSFYPGTRVAQIPEEMRGLYRILDPFVVLAAAAATTTRLKLGTSVCVVTEHDPIDLAKRVASLDRLSGGRFLFGIGAGWLAEAMWNTPFEQRWEVTRDRLAAMQALWTQEEAEYHGPFVDVPRTVMEPKPVQQPAPPTYIGANSRWARQRVLDWPADGWLPAGLTPGQLAPRITDLRRRAETAGRDPASITVTTGASLEALTQMEEAGVDRCNLRLPPATDALEALDRCARAAKLGG